MKNKIEYEFSKSPGNKKIEKNNEKKNFDDQVISVLDKSILYKRKETKSDVQKLKELYNYVRGTSSDVEQKIAIYGALDLYITFINLFTTLLTFFGDRRE